MAIGETVVILLGGIDLSLAALASLASVLLAYSLPSLGWLGLLLVLVFVMLAGALQGVIHAKAQVPSFIVTLAGMGLWGGIAITVAHTTVPINKGYEVVGWLKGSTVGVPHSFAFALVVLLIMAAAMRWLPLGRYIYAIGLAEPAAIISGIRTTRIKVLAFTLSGLLAGLTAMVMVARTYGGNPTIANALQLPAIAAVVVGGTAITGGFGGLGRTLVGALSITVMRVGIAVMGVDPGYEPVVYGLLVIVAVILTIDRSQTPIVK